MNDSIETRMSVAQNDIDHLKANDNRLERSVERIGETVESMRDDVHMTSATTKTTSKEVESLRDEMRHKHAHLESQIAKNSNAVKDHVDISLGESMVPVNEKADRTNRKVSWLIVVLAVIEVVGQKFPYGSISLP